MSQPASMRPVAVLLLAAICMFSSCATSKLSRSGQRKVKGKTFVIIGASSGFGRGVAEQLGRYGANVVLGARRAGLLEEVAEIVRKNGGSAEVVPMDISKEDDVAMVAQAAVGKYGHIDVWINDAGVGAIGRFWEIPIADHGRMIDVNLKGFIYGTHYALQQFRKQGYGVLINLGSVESEVPLAYHASYAATKAAIRAMDQAINQELRLSGLKPKIRVVTIEPWATDTPFWGHAANYSGGTPRMALMDPPDKVVNAIIWSSLHRRKELPVGWKARLAWKFHHMAPHFTEWMSAQVIHKSQIRNAPQAPDNSGSVQKPMETGRGIDDGVRRRMREERRERKHRH